MHRNEWEIELNPMNVQKKKLEDRMNESMTADKSYSGKKSMLY